MPPVPAIIILAALLSLITPPRQAIGQFEPSSAGKSGGPVSLQVYKKWIGASGNEANVEIHLSCDGPVELESREINRDLPGGWEISGVPAEGMFCTVLEAKQDSYVPDTTDCRDLLLVPGQDVECTMVNTKVVKRIDMLNRYGLILMICVMLGAGLAAVKKLGPI